jgi:predicted RNase H-like nuclease (RuvC/YqgF family)
VAAYEELEKKHSRAVAAKDMADAAHKQFEIAVAELPEHDALDHEVQELRGELEESTRKMERLEQEAQEMRRKLVRLRNVNDDLLSGAISWLDERAKEQKQ